MNWPEVFFFVFIGCFEVKEPLKKTNQIKWKITEKIFSIYLFVTSILSPERHSINENSNKIECQNRNNWLFYGFLYHTSTDIEKLNDFVYGLCRYVINDVFLKSVGCFLAFITPSRRLGYKCSYSPHLLISRSFNSSKLSQNYRDGYTSTGNKSGIYWPCAMF